VPPGIETLPTLDEVEVSEMSVSYTRDLPKAPLADWEAEATGLPRDDVEYLRREQGSFVSPGLHVQRWIVQSGEPGPYEQLRIHGFTPETPTTTHGSCTSLVTPRPTAPSSTATSGRSSWTWPAATPPYSR
jgi:vanillate O-demethylase monooxygenase subunit